MGLSAGQARLLTITGRKSDCEFESMRLSHQKIALSRELADLSNEYQNSLEQTKLIYDFYGTGDTGTPLSYGILMTPSALNNYMPTTLTDSSGRVVLTNKLAAAARAAGIPQEGLGTLPSETMRNDFLYALSEQSIITPAKAEKMMQVPYNQQVGSGGGTTVTYTTESGIYEELCDHFNDVGAVLTFNLPNKYDTVDPIGGDRKHWEFRYKEASGSDEFVNCDENDSKSSVTIALGDLLKNDKTVSYANLYLHGRKLGDTVNNHMFDLAQMVLESIIDQTNEYLIDELDLQDGYTAKAIEYATDMIKEMYVPLNNTASNDNGGTYYKNYVDYGSNPNNAPDNLGWVGNHVKPDYDDHSEFEIKVDIGNMLESYITFFADYMNGVSKTDVNGKEIFNAERGEKSKSQLASQNQTFEYVWKTGSEISSDDIQLASFYDALFNQICRNGWIENDKVLDNDYMKDMLKNGMYYVTTIKDDGYYYQGNYATNTYIKEVADESLIAQAEAKYNTEKAKLNAKEETLDMKMKSLDTEISSLQTEYDSVKNTISKNIERSFKRYNA